MEKECPSAPAIRVWSVVYLCTALPEPPVDKQMLHTFYIPLAEDTTNNYIIMRKHFTILAVLALISGASCTPEPKADPVVAVSSVSVTPEKLNLVEGQTSQLAVEVLPQNATDKTVSWSSNDSDIVMVGSDGKVIAIKAGSATITAKAGEKTGTCTITVAAKPVPVSGISLNETTLELVEGDTFTLSATVAPDDATDKTVSWKSSDEGVATVADGLVKAVSTGSATITATAGDKSATCTVNVSPLYEYADLGLSVMWGTVNLGAETPEGIGNNYAWGEIEPNKEKYEWVTYKWCDSGYSNNLTKYNTSNAYGAVVDHKTVLDPEDDAATVNYGPRWHTPTKEEWEELQNNCNWNSTSLNGVNGFRISSKENDNSIFIPREVTYWLSSINENTPSRAWHVYYYSYYGRMFLSSDAERYYGRNIRPVMSRGHIAVESITLDKESVETFIGRTVSLAATIVPYYATNRTITWTSSNPNVASVSPDGLVTALKEGNVVITASADGKEATCPITVLKPIEPSAIDLGLSVKWATFNVGAYYPEEYGDAFAWGETTPKEEYTWNNYKWCENGQYNSLKKYNTKNSYGAIVDNKTVLESGDDPATANWGSKWRTPTKEEWEELKNGCNWYGISQKNVAGFRVASKTNDNSIFIPRGVSYWLSSLYENTPSKAWYSYYYSYYGTMYISSDADRYYGHHIRPVCD